MRKEKNTYFVKIKQKRLEKYYNMCYNYFYNKQIKEYNRYVKRFPNKQFLSLLGYEYIEYDYLDYSAPVDAPQNLFEE